jgi:serine phosphatase RsbU (regulator of sigma subunit)
MKYWFYFLVSIFISNELTAQNKKDSLFFYKQDQHFKTLLFNNPDSAYLIGLKQLDFAEKKKNNIWISEALNNIANSFYINNKFDEAEKYYQKNRSIQEQISYFKGLGKTFNNLGNIEKERNKPIKAKKYYLKSLFYRKKIKDTIGVGSAYLNLGTLFDEEGNLPKALEFQFKALRIFERTKENKQIAKVYNNIAIIYKQQKKYKQALIYNFKSLNINKKQNLQYDQATSYNNIANIYVELAKYQEAIINYEKALNIAQKLNDFQLYSMLENNLGVVYLKLNQYKNAKKYFEHSFQTKVQLGDLIGQIEALENLGSLHSLLKEHIPSINYCLKSYELAKKHELIQDLQISCDCLYSGYRKLNQNDNAIKYLEESNKIKETLEKMNSKRMILEQEFNYNYEKKTYEDSLKNITQKQLLQTQIDKEKTKQYSLYGGLCFIFIITLFVYNRFKTSQKQRKIIEQQKYIVEEKNKEITDSITYAKRIQSAILPQSKLVKEFLKDSFILYKPKDIVAGDFYWLEVVGDIVLFAAADCTGHGVPGAMVSVVCNNGLNRAVREFGLTNPNEILDKTRELVIQEFEKSDEDVKDGMDISLCALDTKTNILKWSGANNPLWVLRKGTSSTSVPNIIIEGVKEFSRAELVEVIELKPDKQPIGKYSNSKPFSVHQLQLQKKDIIYIFTDGYQDQFGGPKEKKFRVTQMRELFLSLFAGTMEEQRKIIDESFKNWKGDLEQVDDVCVIGVRI